VTSARKARRRKPTRDERSRTPRETTTAVAPTPSLWTRPLIVIVVIGALLRGYYLTQPMRYDESVTYLYFASQSWTTVVSSYTYPNNHVFHSLLVKAFATVLGDDPWVLRLPAFIAGVAMIPATYAVGRRLFGSDAALIGAALVSASGALTFYSTNARGYTMVCLASLILANALLKLRERPSMAQWSIVVVATAAGIWTVPVMLYPAGGLALWLVLSALRGDTSEPRGDLVRFGLALVATAILTGLLYSPIIANGGLAALTGNSFVRATAWRVFFRQTSSSIEPTFAASNLGYPAVVSVAIAVCAVAGLVQERKTNGLRVSMAGSTYVWCALLLLATHRAPFFRVWLFLVAPVALLAGHGAIRIASRVAHAQERLAANVGGISGGIVVALAVVVLVSRDIETSRDTGTLRDADRIAKAFSGLRPGDRVFAPIPSNGPLAYYFVRTGLDTAYLSSIPDDSARVFLVVNTAEGFALNSGLRDPLLQKFHKARRVAKYPSAEVYQLY
jgi:hypothetical protein